MSEICWNRSLEFHTLMCHGMIETEHIGMQTKTVQRVVAVTILYITTDRMPHICRMNTNLILAPCLQTVLHKTVRNRTVEHTEMRNSISSSVIHRRTVGHV